MVSLPVIPGLVRPEREVDNDTLAQRLRRVVNGEVHFDAGSRALYATDASNYRQVPIAVVVPKTTDDVVRGLEICHEFGVPVLSRGGGTSLAGQCCNEAVVFDFTKYCHGVVEVDADRTRARVLPGTVLDELQAETLPYGLRFGPDPSTHTHCTLGGMIGNNSCGVHAVLSEFFGKGPRTEDNLEELVIQTYDGVRLRVGPTSDDEYRRLVAQGGRTAQIYTDLKRLTERYASEIREKFPNIPRRVSGFNLPALLPENGFNVARALAGSEGTCATILEATVSLAPALPCRALLVVGYDSVYDAGDDIPRVRELRPVGCEGLDRQLVEYLKQSHLYESSTERLPEGNGWLLVEFGADDTEAAERQARRAQRVLSGSRAKHFELVLDPREQQLLWEVRKSALGATAFVPGQPDTWPGWEDAAVPVAKVGRYLREFRALLERYDYGCSLYGHFAQGCVHTRIDFDLTTPSGIAKYRAFTEEAANLVVGFGGSLSGEHGDGQSRADLLERMYGPKLLQAFRKFKRIWDPDSKMNPGKVIDAYSRTTNLRLGPKYAPWQPKTEFAYAADQHDYSRATLRCVGVGKCRRTSGGIMCPSYRVTRDEKHATRGRAHLLFEMLQREVITDGWRSEAVKEALDLCLACKGCKAECPVDVDIAQHKAEFLSHYYRRRLRPRQAFALGLIHWWARLGTRFAGLLNWALSFTAVAGLAKWIAGIAPARSIPQFARRSFLRSRSKSDIGRRGNGSPRPRVVLWPDTFSNHFHPEALFAAQRVLEHAGCDVVVPERPLCCGRPLYDYGMLDLARAEWRKTLNALEGELDRGAKVVGLEPSCVAAFRDELPELMASTPGAARLSQNVHTLAEYLVHELPGYSPPVVGGAVAVQWHCHHRAVMGNEAERTLLDRMGIRVTELSTGCCGMAGAFGFEKSKYDVSRAVAEQELVPAVGKLPQEQLIVADGFSCRQQISQLTGRTAIHLAELVELSLGAERSPRSSPRAPERAVSSARIITHEAQP